MDLRALGSTGIEVSPLGLGTVKLGRNEQVKYPESFVLPDDATVRRLLEQAHALGINLLDTAPAYGTSEERIGRLMPGSRSDWVIVSKVGEQFDGGRSSFDFSVEATRRSVEESLRRLRTDYLDVVLIHSDGEDLRILEKEPVLETLDRLKQEGWIRAHGISSKTVEGGLLAADLCDVLMVTCNPMHLDEIPVIETAWRKGRGVLVKKALSSGHVGRVGGAGAALRFVFSQRGVTSVIIGTMREQHLRDNVRIAEAAIEVPR